MQGCQDWGDVLVVPHSHQDPGSTALDVLELLEALARDPHEECSIPAVKRQRRGQALQHQGYRGRKFKNVARGGKIRVL